MASARRRLRDARQALEENTRRDEAAGITRETPEFRRLNDAVTRAMADVPWWRDEAREMPDRFRYRKADREDAARLRDRG